MRDLTDKKHRRLYKIQQKCIPCEACNFEGWRTHDLTPDKKHAKKLKRHWEKYFGNKIKMRIK